MKPATPAGTNPREKSKEALRQIGAAGPLVLCYVLFPINIRIYRRYDENAINPINITVFSYFFVTT